MVEDTLSLQMKNEREKKLQIILQDALDECERLRQENSKLKAQFNSSSLQPTPDLQIPSNDQIETQSFSSRTKSGSELTPNKKISLFRSLFRGREDVYPVRWESRNGISDFLPLDFNLVGTLLRNMVCVYG